MNEIKQRDHSFDAIRGFCMFLIPLQHFMTGDQWGYPDVHTPGGFAYFAIDLFVMQTFFFLSGYFSKKPARGRQVAVRAMLWPVLLMMAVFAVLYSFGIGIPFHPLRPTYAMWFMLCLFYYRMFHKDYVKIPHLFGVVFAAGLVIGLIPFIGRDLSLARAVNWMPYFLLGYYCKPELLEKLRRLRIWQTLLLLVALLAGVWGFVEYAPFDKYRAVQMSDSYDAMGISWWGGILLHFAVFAVGVLFMIVLFNLFPNRKGAWSYIGENTMPIYIFHQPVKLLFLRFGAGFGLLSVPSPDSFAYLLYMCLLSFAVCVLLASPPFAKLYDLLFVKSYDMVLWVGRRIVVPFGDMIEKGLLKTLPKRCLPESEHEI